jgi:hypothetical protein
MTADSMVFDLTNRAAISVSKGHVSYLHDSDLRDITHTSLGQWLLLAHGWPADPQPHSNTFQ